ncbi:uncharacterized protein EV420DRAFT_1070614 [Desarmillaria tabescens]|uniref:Uncharacterized protein n=1 Tax=Armillaria tabescens TaxID=1929756 RepID=A0AA39MPX8_ARMTA|nr:uncharacterized protein EV420DRAFT_1070614 [Desarmillaria tabescens]KAK0442771.1 hypothetical protein EV420DRAFT_1070614 [Desarmillaria tabescens]
MAAASTLVLQLGVLSLITVSSTLDNLPIPDSSRPHDEHVRHPCLPRSVLTPMLALLIQRRIRPHVHRLLLLYLSGIHHCRPFVDPPVQIPITLGHIFDLSPSPNRIPPPFVLLSGPGLANVYGKTLLATGEKDILLPSRHGE